MNHQELIARVLDGPAADTADIAALERAIASDPEIRRQWCQHLLISEITSQLLTPERGAEAFLEGLAQRHRALQDGNAFTAKVMAHIGQERRQRTRNVAAFALEVAGMAVAASLMVGLLGFAVQTFAGGLSSHSSAASPASDHNWRAIDLLSLLQTKEFARE